MDINLYFRLNQKTLPTESEQLEDLWRVAKLLTPLGLPIKGWYPPADTPEHSLLNEAFDENGPTPAAVAMLKAEKQERESAEWRTAGVWNGTEDAGAAAYTSSLTIAPKPFRCSFEMSSKQVPAFTNRELVLPLVMGLLEMWPAMTLAVQPYKYRSLQKVFPDRPGVGWMLYLPEVLTAQQVPEAGALVPVLGEKRKQTGTIIVSVADEPFSSDNPEHVKIANKIEVRLVDQDLLPRYADM
ncbi:Imm52 family immunity protein [Ralstonia mannitolilytica]|uniref:Imm52 family immunity protein n=1 Tax=Ralstonia mannitolilytica TaxID=105219 RepID=UPI0028F632FC|nr:Imm52 family immunity protein [Ralstonia mannitolilytica]CAJ0738594.1 hypothetical protein R76696_02033 [Ralstonia mannitolilytica]